MRMRKMGWGVGRKGGETKYKNNSCYLIIKNQFKNKES
jgi:hypothetical protein